jgi:hypothetical protein
MKTPSKFWTILAIGVVAIYWMTLNRQGPPSSDQVEQRETPGREHDSITGVSAQTTKSPGLEKPIGSRLARGVLENSRSQADLARQAQVEQDETEAAEAARLKRWKDNFPYAKVYHPELKYDPSLYDQDSLSDDHIQMDEAVRDHAFMVNFFDNPQIYWAEFEQLHSMMAAADRGDNPRITAEIFSHLQHYHKLMSSADETQRFNPQDYSDAIVGLLALERYWPNHRAMSAEEARAMRDRLIEEIPHERMTATPFSEGLFCIDTGVIAKMEAGESLITSNPNVSYYSRREE